MLGADKITASHAIEQLAAGTTANLAKATLNSDGPVSATMLAAMRQFGNASGASSQKEHHDVQRATTSTVVSGCKHWVMAALWTENSMP